MPLHLLGKKSWNVYNPESIARVRRDEDAAKAREQELERQSRRADADLRLKVLRGEEPAHAQQQNADETEVLSFPAQHDRNKSRKRRRLAHEDDTDRDIRLARLDTEAASSTQARSSLLSSNGHLNLIPEASQRKAADEEAQQAAEPMGMRFKDAAGYKSNGKPWYTDRVREHDLQHRMKQDVWGNEDPRRYEREQKRMSSNDPLLAIKRGVKQLRENEKQREEWVKQREQDLYEVERLARRKRKRTRRSNRERSLDGFRLDSPLGDESDETRDLGRNRDHQHHRHRHHSRSPNRQRPHRKRRHSSEV